MVVPNRFQPNFNENMYRTGDLVTLAEDGELLLPGTPGQPDQESRLSD